ncbi:sigma-70 family RNA polymerase sigma factor [Leifsonia shinshuensis]|uniref:RNA polymerase sigma-70 factor (ECF subfamily) n=1 Tax=Leifsonia shinshuensis TaxID=150026 RepID=A0A853D0T7_9MICO|nr:RNA polymerase sigma-70 factor (ECF subfamily) [Leifsonia shinshuensis]
MHAPTPESTGSSVDDRPAVDRLRHGDRGALTELYRRHAGAVYWNAYGVLRSRPDAEEMTADAFLTLWTRRREVEVFGSSALPWLIVTVKNLSRNRLRANERRRTDPLYDADHPADAPSAEDLAALEEAMRLIRGVIAELPVVDQRIFRLCMVDGLSYKEAAARLGLAHGSVRNRLSRVRLRLRRELGEGS